MNQQTLIVTDPAMLEKMLEKLDAMQRSLDAVVMQPRPEWLNVNAFAEHVGKSRKTVLRWIEAGEVETKHINGVRMVKL